MTERSRGTALRYGGALAATAAAIGARMALDPALGENQPLALLFLALVAVAVAAGLGPALVVLAGGLASFPLIFRAPRHSFALPSTAGWVMMASLTLVGGAAALICASLRSAMRRAELANEALRREALSRERVEAELRDREAHWRTLIENGSDAIALISASGELLYLSPAATRITGYAPEEVLGSAVLDYVHPEDREAVQLALGQTLSEAGGPVSARYRLRHKDGSWRWIESVATNHLADPAIGAVVVNARDVTDRAAAETALREEEARFRAFMDHSPAITYMKDEAGRYLWGNRAWTALFGRAPEELVGLDDFALFPEEAARTFRQSDRRALESGLIEVEESVGDRHFMSLKFPLEHRGARYVGGKTLDITDRVRDREAARDSARLLLALADSMPQIVWSADPEGRVEYFNRRWYEYTGLSPEQSLGGDGWAAVVHPDDRAQALETWRASVATGGAYQVEYRLKERATGEYRWHLGRALPVRDEAGRIVRWYGTCTDIDDQKRAERAAEAANRAKDRFLAVLSHELRTPLTPIVLTVSALLDDPNTTGDERDCLEMIRRNVALESRLIDDLLDVTRIVEGAFALETEPCDAHSLIRQALEDCDEGLGIAGVRVEADLEAGSPTVKAEPARLRQVFANLFRNAAKFSPGGGTMRVVTRDDPGRGRLVVEVRDTGVGIEPDVLPRIFEAFEQGEESPWTRRFGGLGLGLAISRSIIEAHGGSISAESQGAGLGATFRIELPTAAPVPAPTPTPTPPPATEARPLTVPSLRILLIEDDPMTLTTLSRLLRLVRHEVTTADSVAAAMAAAEARDLAFDLVISDIGLPDGNGVELMRILQERRAVPAIALSGFGRDEDVRRSLDAGFRAHLIKPIDFRTLESTIREVVV